MTIFVNPAYLFAAWIQILSGKLLYYERNSIWRFGLVWRVRGLASHLGGSSLQIFDQRVFYVGA